MKRNASLVLSFLTALLGSFSLLTFVSPDLAFAKPPPWAPAHGYRRKHHDDNDDQGDDDHDHDRWNREDAEDWKKKLDEELENKFPHYAEFRALDTNHDGRISFSEWMEAQDLFNRL